MEITIRTADPSDAEAMLKCYTAPLAARNTLQIPYRSLESVREQLTKSGRSPPGCLNRGRSCWRDRSAHVFEAASQSQSRGRDDGSRRLAGQRRRRGADAGGN